MCGSSRQITAVGSQSSHWRDCFFFSSLRDITVYDLRVRAPVQTLRLNSSLGAISSLVYGADCGAGFMQT